MSHHRDHVWKRYEWADRATSNDQHLMELAFPLETPQVRLPETFSTKITLKIGPVVFSVESRTPSLSRMICHQFPDSLGNPEVSSLKLVCESKHPAYSEVLSAVIAESIEARSSYWLLRTRNFEATYFPRHRLAWSAMPESAPVFRKLLQMLFTLWLHEQNGLLIQGMAVVHHGRGYLLLDAPEHNGLNAIPYPALLMGDVMSVVVPADTGGYWIHPTPLGSQAKQSRNQAGAPLVGIIFLRNDFAQGLSPITPQEATARLQKLARWFSKDPAASDALKNRLHRLTQEVRGREVSCVSNELRWEELDAAC